MTTLNICVCSFFPYHSSDVYERSLFNGIEFPISAILADKTHRAVGLSKSKKTQERERGEWMVEKDRENSISIL